ncbi:thiol-disulfide oxidoreductase DCC family protein [Paractinoplanes atraurantiacus]|uniref:DUF393 domain-containing protein n=1 Tax=Paractinoplanes atraurantiacus TaxID=1036182 RepID=A0A285FK74_9ACTN|nr:DUF393 domain-containing protein [Actinoplanes atraurantiacus]SNY11625.1 Protein of unknown function, DUF393 [Actinoplanes atraurantiacus]
MTGHRAPDPAVRRDLPPIDEEAGHNNLGPAGPDGGHLDLDPAGHGAGRVGPPGGDRSGTVPTGPGEEAQIESLEKTRTGPRGEARTNPQREARTEPREVARTEPQEVAQIGLREEARSEPQEEARTEPQEEAQIGLGEEARTGPRGEGRIRAFTVLYDAGCPICRAAGRWLRGRDQLVPLEFLPAGSAEARERFAGLDHDATLRDITVIGDDGSVYVGDGAWVACLWALADYRAMAERISSPALLPSARRFIAAVSAIREATRSSAGQATLPPAGQETRPSAGQARETTRSSAGPVGEGRDEWALDYGGGCDDRCR